MLGKPMKSIFIVGAGQLGSRHLQALKAVKSPLDITVIDPSALSLKIAQERYEGIAGEKTHRVRYLCEIPRSFDAVDIAIIPSTSNVRREIIEGILSRGHVQNMILEKLLFNHRDDYFRVNDLLESKAVKTWVNCSMRTMPFYAGLKSLFQGSQFFYTVTGSQFGLITNAVHYIDHMAYLSGELSYQLDSSLLDYPPIASKRQGFLELNGTLSVKFTNGCTGTFTCFREGASPVMVAIASPDVLVMSKEWEGKALISKKSENWKWNEVDSPIPYQSQMTSDVVTSILTKGTCNLVEYDDSLKIHLTLLEGLQHFLNGKSENKYDLFPFT
ncbi:MAG: oxidoreductase [Deltaproteobacteria bacterium HGW-Deltaproteobacteria-12]|jgi:predicted dehydrogenase|nr:MAG: oxidoreductase [Deltaproteobacteria bacterium HGW-Deltaproteobacteria-12]